MSIKGTDKGDWSSKQDLKLPDDPIELPEHGSCFICGSQNPKGLGLVWYAQAGAAPIRSDDAIELPNILVYSEFSSP